MLSLPFSKSSLVWAKATAVSAKKTGKKNLFKSQTSGLYQKVPTAMCDVKAKCHRGCQMITFGNTA